MKVREGGRSGSIGGLEGLPLASGKLVGSICGMQEARQERERPKDFTRVRVRVICVLGCAVMNICMIRSDFYCFLTSSFIHSRANVSCIRRFLLCLMLLTRRGHLIPSPMLS